MGAISFQKPDLRRFRVLSLFLVFQETHGNLDGKARRLLLKNSRPGPIQLDSLRADNFGVGQIPVHS
jgi:hypothetical protein